MNIDNKDRAVSLTVCMLFAAVLAAPVWAQCQGWWSRDLVPNLSQPRDMTCSAVVDGKMYVLGGHNHNDVPGLAPNYRVEAYDPAENAWSLRADMPTGRGMAACAVVDGLVYVIGGNNCESNCWLFTNEAYSPQTNTWQPRAPIPTWPPRGLFSATTVNGKVFCIGGGNSYESPAFLDKVEAYDPEANTWQSLPPIPYGNRSQHAAVEMDGEIYLIGGARWLAPGVHQLLSDVDVYNPTTGQWRQVAPLPTPRTLLSAVVLNGKIYAIGGGADDTGTSPVVEEYDSTLDCWRGVTRLPFSTTWGTAEVLGRKIYLVCGDVGFGSGGGHEGITDEVIVGYPTQLIGDINGDGVTDFSDINPFVAVLTGNSPGCPAGWTEYGGHCYRLTSVGTWEQAETEAVNVGGHLVAVGTAAENAWLVEQFGDENRWIGLRQLPGSAEPDGGWVWSNGEPTTYTNWCPGEPNNNTISGDECYAEMKGGASYCIGRWNDLASTYQQRGIVEVSP